MDNCVHILKLCVGAESVTDLTEWQVKPRAKGPDGLPRHITRMWPKRQAEVVAGGSIYWVIKGVILARQKILRFDPVDHGDGIQRCGLVFDPKIVRTEAQPKRPFQGWRYLKPEDAPRDLSKSAAQAHLPPTLEAALAEIGVR